MYAGGMDNDSVGVMLGLLLMVIIPGALMVAFIAGLI